MEILTVRDLIELLQKCPQDNVILAEIDGEEESAEISDVLIGGGTTNGVTYLKIEPYKE